MGSNNSSEKFETSEKNYDVEPSNIELKEFNILEALKQRDNFAKPTKFLLIGKRQTGKTYLIKEILLLLKNENIVDNIMIFSGQSSVNEYKSIVQPNQINKIKNTFDNYDMKKILENQIKPNAKPLLLILDDGIFCQKSLYSDKLFLNIMTNARHYNIYVIITMQYPVGLSPELKILFDFVFIFQDDCILNKKRLYDHYFGIIPDYKLFDKIMSDYCSNYGILVIDNFSNSNLFENKVKQYKCKHIIYESIYQIELFSLDNEEDNDNKNIN